MQTAINIYQIFTRLFANQNETNKEFGTIQENGCSKFNDITPKALKELKKMGATHIWYTGVIRHASCSNYSKYGLTTDNPFVVKGRAGSPYAIKDYFDVDPDLATNVKTRMKEFEDLIERTHKADLKCIMDFVPNHVSREYHSDNIPDGGISLGSYDDTKSAFSPNNNFYYVVDEELHLPNDIDFPYVEGAPTYYEYPAKVTGNDVFSSYPSRNDWYETIKLNYGVDYQDCWRTHFEQIPDTWIRMLEILTFWAKKNVDGFRCDMAEMVPVQFWSWVIPQIKKINPEIIFIAEIYNPDAYENYLNVGHFDYLYDKVGLYDTMRMIVEGRGNAKFITDYWRRTERVQGKMLRFLENHDEQRIASRFFADNANKGRAAMMLLAMLNPGPLMIYFGQEIGEKGMDKEGFSGVDGRTTIFDYWSLTEFNKWVNGGKFDGALLSPEQKDLREYYSQLLNFRLQHEAIQNGLFYDLMWKNCDERIDSKIFAFLRYTENEKLLFVLNFDFEQTVTLRLSIGDHAFETMNCPLEGTLVLKEVFDSDFEDTYEMSEVLEKGVPLSVLPNSALVFSLEWK
ncbi:MAG: alpha-amylase family glycosyl hydrolase [Bacteroidales bacterium]|nr:alpha-amylase family glycosyl hydrolase [Bacteroidales bacterium]